VKRLSAVAGAKEKREKRGGIRNPAAKLVGKLQIRRGWFGKRRYKGVLRGAGKFYATEVARASFARPVISDTVISRQIGFGRTELRRFAALGGR